MSVAKFISDYLINIPLILLRPVLSSLCQFRCMLRRYGTGRLQDSNTNSQRKNHAHHHGG